MYTELWRSERVTQQVSTGSAVTNDVELAGSQNDSPATVFARDRVANVPKTEVSWGQKMKH